MSTILQKGASSADNSTAVAVAWGYKSKAKGCIGAHIVCAEWKYDKFKSKTLKGENVWKRDLEENYETTKLF